MTREVEDRVDEGALLHDFVAEPGLVGRDGGGEAARPGADDDEVEVESGDHSPILHRARRLIPARRALHGQQEVGAERAARRLETGGHAAAEDTLHGHVDKRFV